MYGTGPHGPLLPAKPQAVLRLPVSLVSFLFICQSLQPQGDPGNTGGLGGMDSQPQPEPLPQLLSQSQPQPILIPQLPPLPQPQPELLPELLSSQSQPQPILIPQLPPFPQPQPGLLPQPLPGLQPQPMFTPQPHPPPFPQSQLPHEPPLLQQHSKISQHKIFISFPLLFYMNILCLSLLLVTTG